MPVLTFIKKRIDSVKYAINGIFLIITTQHNAWIHFVMTVFVAACGFWLKVSTVEWMMLVLAIVSVWVAEGLNTAIEHLGDIVSPKEYHPLVGKSKDVAAGAVLISSIGAAIIGTIVFAPKILTLF